MCVHVFVHVFVYVCMFMPMCVCVCVCVNVSNTLSKVRTQLTYIRRGVAVESGALCVNVVGSRSRLGSTHAKFGHITVFMKKKIFFFVSTKDFSCGYLPKKNSSVKKPQLNCMLKF